MKISRRVLLAVAAAGLAAVAAATAAHSGRLRLQDHPADDAHAGRGRLDGDAADHRRRHTGERLPVRVDSRRDLVPDQEQEQARPVREPRDVARPVPVHAVGADRGELTERLRQLAAQPPRGRPRHGRDPLRRVRDRERRELPAVLLELPRRRGERLRQAAALHERGGDRLGQAQGLRVPGDDRCGRRTPDRRRRRPRPEERQVRCRSGAWAATTTRTASPCRATAIPSSSRATTRS